MAARWLASRARARSPRSHRARPGPRRGSSCGGAARRRTRRCCSCARRGAARDAWGGLLTLQSAGGRGAARGGRGRRSGWLRGVRGARRACGGHEAAEGAREASRAGSRAAPAPARAPMAAHTPSQSRLLSSSLEALPRRANLSETRPVSTGGGTGRVRSVREEGRGESG